MNNNRFMFKVLGVVTMEIIQVTPKEVRKTMWNMAYILFIVIILIKAPAYLQAFHYWH